MAEAVEKKSVREIARMTLRRRRLFLLASATFVVVALIASHYLPLKYTGSAKFTRRVDPASEKTAGGKSESFDSRKLTLQNDLAGYKAIESTIESLGLTRSFPHNADGSLTVDGEMKKQELIREVIKDVKIDWEVRSDQVDLISVSYTDSDPDLTEKIPNTLVHEYIAWISDQIVSSLRASEEFLKEKVDKCTRQYESLNAERINYEAKNAGFQPTSPGILQERIQQITSDLDVIRRQRMVAEKKLAHFGTLMQPASVPATSQPATDSATAASQASGGSSTQTASGPATAPSTQPYLWVKAPTQELQRLTDQYRDLRSALDVMINVSGMTESHPAVTAQRQKVEQARQQLDEANAQYTRETASSTITAVRGVDLSVELAIAQSEVEMTTKETERLEARLAEYTRLAANIAPIREQYDQIVKKLSDKQAELKNWEARYLEVQMALQSESAKKRTLHESVLAAQPQFKPSFPTLGLVLGLALAGGLGCGVGLVVLANVMDHSISTPEEATKHVGIPVYGVIGEIITQSQRVTMRLRRWIVNWTLAGVLLAAIGLSTLSVVAWLNYPAQYKGWHSSVEFVRSQLAGAPENHR